MVCAYGGSGGRGNLRENREDPAPTVGNCGDIIAICIAPKQRPLPPPPCAYRATHGAPGFYHDAARRYKRTPANMTMRDITTGKGGLDRMRGEGRDGRGNLRENREDPAPTVGRLRGFHCGPHRAQRPPIAAASMCVPCPPRMPST